MRLNPLPYVQRRVYGAFRRKPNRFMERLCQQTTMVMAGTTALIAYLDNPTPTNAARIRSLERAADDVRRQLIGELNQTFVTPIDREDLFALSRAIDDVIDHVYSTTVGMETLHVAPNQPLCTIANLLSGAAIELHHAAEHLEHDAAAADSHAFRVKKIANEGETWYAEALAALFTEPDEIGAVMNLLKLREIYIHMSDAVHSAEQAADIISDIIVKLY